MNQSTNTAPTQITERDRALVEAGAAACYSKVYTFGASKRAFCDMGFDFAAIAAAVPAAQQQAQSDLSFVIKWLEGGGHPAEAVQALRKLQAAAPPPAATPARELSDEEIGQVLMDNGVQFKYWHESKSCLTAGSIDILLLIKAVRAAAHLATPQGERDEQKREA